MGHLFWGGVHPADRKELFRGAASTPAPLLSQVVIPMAQHIDKPCTPLVKVGGLVELGQKIGDAEGPSATIHASVLDTVTVVEPRPHLSDRAVLSVVIDNDHQDTSAQTLGPHATHERLPPNDILSIIRGAGVVGIGDTTFPIDIKTVTAWGRVDTILVSACEYEPYITVDDALLCSYLERIFRGLVALDAALHPDRRVVTVEDNKSEAIAVPRRHLLDWPGMELAVPPTRYPQGMERQLIQAVTGRQVSSGHLPSFVSCAVSSAGTVATIHRAVYEGRPVAKRTVTATGEGAKEPKNLTVHIGAPFAQAIKVTGGLTEDARKVLSGGPMMGTAQNELATPVLKGTGTVLYFTSANPTPERPVCIRCSKCVEVCSMHLQPLHPYRYEAVKNLDALQTLHVADYIEYSCCSYTCPGQLPLTERFRAAKQTLKERIRS